MALGPPAAALPANEPPWYNSTSYVQPLLHPGPSPSGMLPTSGTSAPDVLALIPPLVAPIRCKIRPEQQLDPGQGFGILEMTGQPLAFTSAKAARLESQHRAVGGFRLTIEPPAQYSNILAQHNSYRAKHQVLAMQWDALLAQGAADFASGCVFEHDAASNAGENLYAVSATGDTATSLLNAVKLW